VVEDRLDLLLVLKVEVLVEVLEDLDLELVEFQEKEILEDLLDQIFHLEEEVEKINLELMDQLVQVVMVVMVKHLL
jgi:hypothetical protein